MALEIPDFLRVTPEQAKARREYNAAHPIAPAPFLPPAPPAPARAAELTSEAQAIIDDQEARSKIKKRNSLEKMLAKKREAVIPGMRWSNGAWVMPDEISRAKYDRILRELPTEAHKKIFREHYSTKVKEKKSK